MTRDIPLRPSTDALDKDVRTIYRKLDDIRASTERLEKQAVRTTTDRLTGFSSVQHDQWNRMRSIDQKVSAAAVTLTSHGHRLDAIDTELIQMNGRLETIDGRLESHDQRFDAHDRRFDSIDARLAAHDEQFVYIGRKLAAHDERFDEVDARFDGVDRRFDAVDQRFEGVDKRFDGVDQRFDSMDSKLDTIIETLGGSRSN